ncbi:PTS lactose/cellobiose transporter subunit IIA [Martelella alba]|uniref:PTS lactose/cellobiose transporter subunit IIA n=2 Tax=Martelella alba TaxID=2590451 RepID=A0ABY2SNH7_9HYPH|nr:PTS lactose/cellobiose transporter subunit IIA [Martelella alba]
MNDDAEQTVMELLIHAGDARSGAMGAIASARNRRWREAETQMEESRQAARRAHAIQTRLIGLDEGSGKIPVNLILAHAQDHLMTTMLCQDMAQEFIWLHRRLAELE